MKTVSVIMATYNGEKFLGEQLDSILQQTYPILEIIVQDDCSTDGTRDVVRDYAKRYPFIKLYVNERNIGFNQNFKAAVMKAVGDYVAISDQDDVWQPEKIEKQMNVIGDHDICYTYHTRGVTPDGSSIRKQTHTFELLLFDSSVSGHNMLCRRAFVQNSEHWMDSIWYDWSLSLHASLGNGLVGVAEPLIWHREHPKEVTSEFFTEEKAKKTSKWKPYIYGLKGYRQLLKNKNRERLYTYLYGQTTDSRFLHPHQLCGLLVKTDLVSFLRLCRLCQKNRKIFSPTKSAGMAGWVQGFFYPFFHGYFCMPDVLFRDFTSQNKKATEIYAD